MDRFNGEGRIMYLTRDHQILFQSLNAALGDDILHDINPDEVDPPNLDTLFKLAKSQGVMALTMDGLNFDLKSLDKELWLSWNMSVKRVENRYARQREVLKELGVLFRSYGIELMVLKGIGTSMHYPRPEHRESGDIDIYLMGDYGKGNEIIESMGIEVDKKGKKHSNFFFKGIPIENHKTFLNVSGSLIDRHLESELSRILHEQGTDTILLDDVPVRIPTPDFQAIFLTRHAIVHFLSSGLVMRYICDLALIFTTRSDRIDMPRFEKIMREEGQFMLLCSFLSIGAKCLKMSRIKCCENQSEQEFVAKLSERVLEEAFLNIYRSISKEDLLKMAVIKRKLLGIKRFFSSKWKYDSIRKGLFFSVLFYILVQNLRISNWR